MSQTTSTWYEQAKDNAERIETELISLSHDHQQDGKYNYRAFWNHAKSITHLFKELKPLLREDRESLWNNFNDIRDHIRERGDKERSARQKFSKELRTQVETIVNDVNASIADGPTLETLKDARSALDRAMTMLKKPAPPIVHARDPDHPIQINMFREDRDHCWKIVRDTLDDLNERRKKQQDDVFETMISRAETIKQTIQENDPYEALEAIKALQGDLKEIWLSRSQRDRLRKLLNSAWDQATKEIEVRKGEKRQNFEDWQNRLKDNLERWEALLEKNEGVLQRLADQIEKLETDIEESTSDEFIERANGWVKEKQAKIADIKKTNADISTKVKSARKRLKLDPIDEPASED